MKRDQFQYTFGVMTNQYTNYTNDSKIFLGQYEFIFQKIFNRSTFEIYKYNMYHHIIQDKPASKQVDVAALFHKLAIISDI